MPPSKNLQWAVDDHLREALSIGQKLVFGDVERGEVWIEFAIRSAYFNLKSSPSSKLPLRYY